MQKGKQALYHLKLKTEYLKKGVEYLCVTQSCACQCGQRKLGDFQYGTNASIGRHNND